MERCAWFSLLGTILFQFPLATCQEFCSGTSFWCNSGHCCGGGRCCSYYYELWWFWAIWAAVIILSCCCLYQQRRFRHRRRSHHHRGRGLPLSGCRSRIVQAIDATFVIPLFDSDRVRLPTYDEVKELPPDPPPYDRLSDLCLPESSIGCPEAPPVRLPPSTSLTDTPSECVEVSLIANEGHLVRAETPCTDPPPPYSSKSSICEQQNPV